MNPPASDWPPRNQTGAMELCLAMIAGMIGAAALGFAGAGWWSLLAMPGCVALYIVSVLRRHSS